MLTDSGGWTLPLGVTNFSQQYTTDTAKVLAFTTLSMVPALDLLRVRRAPAHQGPDHRGGQGVSVAATPYLDPALAVADRVDDLLGRMTLEEKLAQLGSIWVFEVLDVDRVEPGKAQERLGAGIGQITRVAGATSFEMPVVAALANEIQRFLVQGTRLGIPAIVHEECLHGLVARDAVCFPQSIGLAAAWDPELLEALASSFARQLRAMGAHQGLAPIFDVARDPRWGRIEETYGEDPYLIAALGVAYVRGLQEGGGAPVLATGKHMVGHGLPEGGMNRAPAHIGPRELRDVYLWPFEAAVREAGMRSMMHAYEDVDGVPCVASRELFTTTLREEWGFDGIVVSDYAGIDELVESHAIVGDLGAAAALALEAGIDVELPSTAAFGAPLAQALAAGDVDPALVDRAVARVLAVKFELGLFEAPYVDAAAARPPLETDRALARDAARASIVLLENDGTLPLRDDLATIAVIGPNADSARNLLGDYAHVAHIETLLEMRDNPIGFPVPDDLDLSDELEGRSTILDAIRERCAHGAEVRFAAGGDVLDASDAEIAEAADAARGADVAIVVVGERSGLTLACTCGEMRDRMELGLPGRQEELVAAVAATGTPVVLVLVAGRPLAIPEAAGARGGRAQRLGARRRGAGGDRGDPVRRRRTRAASCRSPCPATSARSRSTTRTSPRAGARTGTATTSTARTCRCGPSATGSPTRASRCTAPSSTARRSRWATRWPSPSRSRTSASARATRSSSSTCATRRPASRGRSRSCAASGACTWPRASAGA